MNILRIIPTVSPAYGGPIEGLTRSAQAMQRWGHTTEVATLDAPDAEHVATFPFAVHPCGPGFGGYGLTSSLPMWVAANSHRFDAAVISGIWNYASFGAWLGLRASGLPYVQFVHGMMDPWFNHVQPIKRWAKQAYWLALEGHVMGGARAALFTTEEERHLARTSFWGHAYKERVVAYGAADVPASSPNHASAFAAATPALNGRPYLLYLGRLHPKKGCDLLVRAFADLGNADIDLVIAGPDPVGLEAELRTLAAQLGIGHRIHWPGMLQGDAKHGAFSGAQAFVLPSHQENFGIAVAEALAWGLPVLITDKVNIWREVEANHAGLVRPDTAEGVRALIGEFFALPSAERADMRRNARAVYEGSFSIDGAARDLVLVLEEARAHAGR